jgi:hypothetical protein
MEPSVQTDRVAAYLAEVGPHLDDLGPTERAEVLDELTAALREVAAEDDRPLREVLGPAADYVAAYRASAGLESHPSRSRGRLRTQIAAMAATVRAQPWSPPLEALARLLRPSWWTLRGAVLAVALLTMLFPRSQGDVILSLPGALVITTAVAVSMAVGSGRRAEALRVVLMIVNVAALVAIPALTNFERNKHLDIRNDAADMAYRHYGDAPPGQLARPSGEPVGNIHPYTRDGEPVQDLLLFDDEGQPLRVVPEGEDVLRAKGTKIEIDYERDADGQPITNLYPLRQFVLEHDDATGEEARRPRTAPAVVLPPALRTDASEAPASETAADAAAPAAAPSEP